VLMRRFFVTSQIGILGSYQAHGCHPSGRANHELELLARSLASMQYSLAASILIVCIDIVAHIDPTRCLNRMESKYWLQK
jgi:hypothetical protein